MTKQSRCVQTSLPPSPGIQSNVHKTHNTAEPRSSSRVSQTTNLKIMYTFWKTIPHCVHIYKSTGRKNDE